MYEPVTQPPLPDKHFRRRVLLHFLASQVLIAASLAIGMAGYTGFEHLGWRDAFLNSAMLLGGMGPVNSPTSDNGKVFAGVYALYCGLVFLGVAAILVAPLAHRLLHKFHWESDDR
jgi:hypothetical protein